nr:hypothetical protein [Tanacetum cinerariifolium]
MASTRPPHVPLPLSQLDKLSNPIGRPMCQFQVFRSVCKSIGLRSVIRFDAQELKILKWYVLHNSPEIDTYSSWFKSLFPNKDMKEEFPNWFGSQIRQCHVDNDKDPEVSTTKDDPDIIHFDNSSDLLLSTSLNDLDNVTLHIDGQSTEVDVPPDMIDVVDEDDDITDDEDALPHDLADFDNETSLIPTTVTVEVRIAPSTPGKGKRKPNLGGTAAGRLNTRDKTQNLSLKEIMDTKGPVPI